MNPLISDTVKDSLVNQMAMEKRNANMYLVIAAFFKKKGLDNIAAIFEEQNKEEERHALFLYKLLCDLNEEFDMPSIDGFQSVFNSISEVGELYLQREIETTESLKEIRFQAADETMGGCPVVEVAILELLKMQQEELSEASTFKDKCEIIGNDWKTALIWDASLS